jgi:hypothetical protein
VIGAGFEYGKHWVKVVGAGSAVGIGASVLDEHRKIAVMKASLAKDSAEDGKGEG